MKRIQKNPITSQTVLQERQPEKYLCVKWEKDFSSGSVYYIDKNQYSMAHKKGNTIILDSYSGTYSFDIETAIVTLDTGTEKKIITVKEWHVE